ncbi:MAG TPA: UDP-glucose/GDP-mannose dehydrogenase family protein [Candidatus Saccharimonadales bacterium]|nr:UDP-glucose/GDP-mannose dehydrogenase family protein [Candidatus Saccharimonadales bacterium]
MKKIAVVGTGYVGLTAAAYLADRGNRVVGVDIDADKVAQLNQGILPIVEEGLDAVVNRGITSGSLTFSTDTIKVVQDVEIVFLCLPTPMGEGGEADLSYVLGVAAQIRDVLRPGAIVVNKSTVPVGTAAKVTTAMGRDDVYVVSNPEFLREGSAVYDMFNPDRVVIGARSPEAARRIADLYKSDCSDIMQMSPEQAELVKYASNSYLAMKLSFVNMMSNLAERMGVDVHRVLEAMGADHRIGEAFLKPGPGWGGSCFPKDVQALLYMAELMGVPMELLVNAVDINERQIASTVNRARDMVGGDLQGRTVAVWGLAFKAGTDDVRDSPSHRVIELLQMQGAKVVAFDPAVGKTPFEVARAETALEACVDADILLVMTEWPEFGKVNLMNVARLMRYPRVLDMRAVLGRDELARHGFMFETVGHGVPMHALV